MAKSEVIGRIKGHDVKWNSKTGEITLRRSGLFSSYDKKLERRAKTIPAVFAIVEDYLHRKRWA